MSKPVFRSELDAVLLLKDREKVEAERRVKKLRGKLKRAERNVARRKRFSAWIDRRLKIGYARLVLLPAVDMDREGRRLEVRREHVRRHAVRLEQKARVARTLKAQLEIAESELMRIEAELDSYRRQREIRYKQFLAKQAKKEDNERDDDQIIRFNQKRDP